MQPFMKNVSVEYAEKAAPGGEIDKSIKELKDIPVLTEDNAKEIFEKRPKFIKYDYEGDIITYSLVDTDTSETDIYYSSVYENKVYSLGITSDGQFQGTDIFLATEDNVGTRLYRHEVVLNISTSTGSTRVTLEIISTDGVANTSYSGGPARFNKTKFSTVVSIYALAFDYFVGAGRYSDDSLIIGITRFSQSDYPKLVTIDSFVSDTVTPL